MRAMQDLNDLALFASVVDAGGYSAAERHTGIPKSRLSRRVTALEAELGVRLIQRTANRFFVTEAGQRVYRHARAIADEADALAASVAETLGEPAGLVRVTAAPLTGELWLAGWLAEFAVMHPKVRIALSLSNRYVDILTERFDLAVRFSSKPLDDADVVARPIGRATLSLMASPAFVAAHGEPNNLDALADLPAIVLGSQERPRAWAFTNDDGSEVSIMPRARLIVNNVVAAREAVIAGAGMAQLPPTACREALAAGKLRTLLPHHAPPASVAYAVYPSRRGASAAMRELVTFLEARFRTLDNMAEACERSATLP